MNKKQKKVLTRIIIAFVLLVLLRFLPVDGYLRMALYMVPYLVIGYDILKKAFKGIRNRQVFDENFLMAVATIGAIALGDYQEGTAVMLFYQIGELFQSYAVGKSRRNISELMDIRPDYANIEQDGKLEKVDPDEVEVGTIIVVQPGEKIPIDGMIEDGNSTLNTSALTGESLPRDAKVGDEVISGCINMTGVLKIRTTKEFGESTVSKILRTPAPKNPDLKTLFQNLRNIIPRQSATVLWHLQSFRLFAECCLWDFLRNGETGSTVP